MINDQGLQATNLQPLLPLFGRRNSLVAVEVA